MKRLALNLLLIIPIFIFSSWGFYAHRRINQLAIFCLPKSMLPFYRNAISYLVDHSVDPDKKRYIDTLEAPRHYLDVEKYESNIDSIPFKWKDAQLKYGDSVLKENGILPWHIETSYYRLVKAFQNLDSLGILKHSAYLGHYIGDAHVPLHTTHNHNGQLTNQHGIHGFWESRIPELFAKEYRLGFMKAIYIKNPLQEAWKIIKESHQLVDSVLTLESKLDKSFPSDQKYSYTKRNNIIINQYSKSYSAAFQNKMNGMVEKRMRASILSIASFWYSAWIDAGQPLLTNLNRNDVSSTEKQANEAINKKFKMGKIIGREL